ncbi:hypothetical protein FXO38_13640 [Capsicum annuum]|nr:hypothetical protein FXO38_13640 [Capsicum annuum]
MLKALMPIVVYAIGTLLKNDSFKKSTIFNMVAISVGVAIAVYGESKFDTQYCCDDLIMASRDDGAECSEI